MINNQIESILNLKKSEGKDIWLAGGARLITSLLNTNLIDELIVTYIPTILENGTPLFANKQSVNRWLLKDEIFYNNSTFKRTYRLKP